MNLEKHFGLEESQTEFLICPYFYEFFFGFVSLTITVGLTWRPLSSLARFTNDISLEKRDLIHNSKTLFPDKWAQYLSFSPCFAFPISHPIPVYLKTKSSTTKIFEKCKNWKHIRKRKQTVLPVQD